MVVFLLALAFARPLGGLSKDVSSRRCALQMGVDRRALLASGAAAMGSVLLPPMAFATTAATLPQCDQAVDMLTGVDGRRIFLCGTAHISAESAALVRDLIRSVKPNTVMVELDRARLESLFAKDSLDAPRKGRKSSSVWDDLRGPGTIGERVGRAQSNAIGRVLSDMYESLEEMGFSSGEEFRVAVAEALNSNAQVVLGDQDGALSHPPPSRRHFGTGDQSAMATPHALQSAPLSMTCATHSSRRTSGSSWRAPTLLHFPARGLPPSLSSTHTLTPPPSRAP